MPSISGRPVKLTKVPQNCAPINRNNILVMTEFGLTYSGNKEEAIPHDSRNIINNASGCELTGQCFSR